MCVCVCSSDVQCAALAPRDSDSDSSDSDSDSERAQFREDGFEVGAVLRVQVEHGVDDVGEGCGVAHAGEGARDGVFALLAPRRLAGRACDPTYRNRFVSRFCPGSRVTLSRGSRESCFQFSLRFGVTIDVCSSHRDRVHSPSFPVSRTHSCVTELSERENELQNSRSV